MKYRKGLDVSLSLFKGSNDWLRNFRARHNISYNSTSGESTYVDSCIADDSLGRIQKMICVKSNAEKIYFDKGEQTKKKEKLDSPPRHTN